MTPRAKDWCILRTGPARTLKLAASLQAAGIDAWTPTGVVYRRVMRGKKGTTPHDAPIAPGFVFVRAELLPAIFRVLANPLSPHPAFSLFRYLGSPGFVGDHELAFLRALEERERKRARRGTKVEPYQVGESVSMSGAWTGLSAVVEASDGRSTMLKIGPLTIKVETCALRDDRVATSASAA
jgi:hypothetical protein